MARKVFFSFYFDNDYWRTQQVRNMGVLEGQALATPNRWEELKRAGDEAIKRWIRENIAGKSCLIVMIGSETSERRYVNYEIEHAWNTGKGVLGVRIDRLLDRHQAQSYRGADPFQKFSLCGGSRSMSNIVPTIDPGSATSKDAYAIISANMTLGIENAINARNTFRC